MKFVVLSDLHLVEPGAKLWGLDPFARLERCLEDIERLHGDASFCVITGDLSDTAAETSYALLKRRLSTFPIRTFLLIGNHDDRNSFTSVFGPEHSDGDGFVQRTHSFGDFQCLFLDTFKGGPTSAGTYCEQRREWLARQLDNARGRRILLFMHHPPFDIGHSLMDLIKLEESEEFCRIIADHSIAHLFFGHAHRPISGIWRGIPFAAPPSINHQLPLVPGSLPTVYSDEPAMYAVVMAEADRIIVHMDAFLDRKPAEMETTAERGTWY
jgi:Icc protein